MQTTPLAGTPVAPLFPTVPLALCTSLAKLREARACAEGFANFKRHLRATLPFVTDGDPVPLVVACGSNSPADICWALRNAMCGPRNDRMLRELACDFAERALPISEKRYPDDLRPRKAIEVARRFARGEATDDERRQARAAAAYAAADADAAAYAAADAAYAAAAAAAYAAAAYAAAERRWQTDRLRAVLAAACEPTTSTEVGELAGGGAA